ncbi:hypothetical protein QR721_11630 [Aciduricibacillus chroicocephali]|uniref:Uncharacterized protein n=1 Tax=Aciduricibacillus chroicocephali TaxID=3054939 RepID=A0ABY9KUA8_9BACI|nr:hypothetical protein QR721_11630 [Bacillaceae bacterium 44XB]
MSKIKVVMAKAHEGQREDPDIQREIQDVQKFFDQNDFAFEKETLYFVILRGLNLQIERKLRLAGAFVNKTGLPIEGFRADMKLNVKSDVQAQFAEVHLEIDDNFLGRLEPDEAIVLHIDIPAEGLDPAKQIYGATELAGALENLELLVKN